MVMAFLFPPAHRAPRRPATQDDNAPQTASKLHMAAFLRILARHDDHLIRDIGLTRDEILGPEKAFWSEWLKQKQPWQL